MTTTRTLALALLAALAGCATASRAPRPDDMSAEQHRKQALHERAEARTHMQSYDPRAISAMPTENDERYIRTGPRGALGYYNPTTGQLEEAERHLRHAEAHERAAADLEAFEDRQCRALRADARAACPLLHDVAAVEDIPGGVRVRFRPDTAIDTTVAHMRCHLAYARTRGFPDSDCPLYIRGVRIERVRGQAAVDILGSDLETQVRLRDEVREEVTP